MSKYSRKMNEGRSSYTSRMHIQSPIQHATVQKCHTTQGKIQFPTQSTSMLVGILQYEILNSALTIWLWNRSATSCSWSVNCFTMLSSRRILSCLSCSNSSLNSSNSLFNSFPVASISANISALSLSNFSSNWVILSFTSSMRLFVAEYRSSRVVWNCLSSAARFCSNHCFWKNTQCHESI